MTVNLPRLTAILICWLMSWMMPLIELFAQDSAHPDQLSPHFPTLTRRNVQDEMATPKFAAQIRIKSGSSDMKVDTYTSVPCAVDWNQDGKKDLLVGSFYYGNVYLFLNSGTNAVPVFTLGTKLKAGGVDISVAYG